MKKYFALLLSLVMVLSLVACGKEAEEKTDNTEPAKTEAENDVSSDDEATENEVADEVEVSDEVEISDELTSLLAELSIVEPADAFVGTKWDFSGGMLNGEEMDEAAAAQNLEMYGGQLSIVFDDAEKVSMVQGGGTLEGVYGLTTDNENVLGLIFDGGGSQLIYAGLFADVDGTLVLMLFPDGSGKDAVYFTQSEG